MYRVPLITTTSFLFSEFSFCKWSIIWHCDSLDCRGHNPLCTLRVIANNSTPAAIAQRIENKSHHIITRILPSFSAIIHGFSNFSLNC